MIVTKVPLAVYVAVQNGTVALGAILILCLVVVLVVQEVLGHYKGIWRLSFVYRSLKLLWAPLVLAAILVLGEQLINVGVL